jgi:hypothetical protein
MNDAFYTIYKIGSDGLLSKVGLWPNPNEGVYGTLYVSY